jgi:CRISPR-associated protein Cmr2
LLDQSPGSFLAAEAFGGKESFDSLVEVAMRDYTGDTDYQSMEDKRLKRRIKPKSQRDREDVKDEEELVNSLSKKYGKKSASFPAFRPAHKYVAIVHADGDGIGALIKNLKTEKQFGHFSKSLKMFALDAVQQIKNFGGVPVYAGGDDLLFFAPVVRDQQSKNIFHLLEDLNRTIKLQFKDFDVVPTLSFGVSISFYKFPLFEALEASRSMLFEKAKQYGPRNAIAFSVRKHSGHEFGALLPMQSNLVDTARGKSVFGQFMSMLQSGVQNPGRNLSSINYHVRSNAAMYRLIGSNATQVENFVDNCFDEAIHDSDDTQQYLGDVKTLLPAIFEQHNGDPDKSADMIYALLRTSAFLTENESTLENGEH